MGGGATEAARCHLLLLLEVRPTVDTAWGKVRGREGRGASTALNCFMGEMRTTANPVNWHISVSSSLCAVMNFMRGGGCIVRPCAGGGVYWVWVGGLEIGTSLSLSLRLTHGSL